MKENAKKTQIPSPHIFRTVTDAFILREKESTEIQPQSIELVAGEAAGLK